MHERKRVRSREGGRDRSGRGARANAGDELPAIGAREDGERRRRVRKRAGGRRGRRTLSAPGEVAGLEGERAELEVPAAAAHDVHALLAELGHRARAARLELALLLVDVAAATGRAALVPGITRDPARARRPGWEGGCAFGGGGRRRAGDDEEGPRGKKARSAGPRGRGRAGARGPRTGPPCFLNTNPLSTRAARDVRHGCWLWPGSVLFEVRDATSWHRCCRNAADDARTAHRSKRGCSRVCAERRGGARSTWVCNTRTTHTLFSSSSSSSFLRSFPACRLVRGG